MKTINIHRTYRFEEADVFSWESTYDDDIRSPLYLRDRVPMFSIQA